MWKKELREIFSQKIHFSVLIKYSFIGYNLIVMHSTIFITNIDKEWEKMNREMKIIFRKTAQAQVKEAKTEIQSIT